MPSIIFQRRTILAAALAACLLLAACGGTGAPQDAAQVPERGGSLRVYPLSTPIWYVIADQGADATATGGDDWLYSVDISLAVPLSGQAAVGTGTGTTDIETAAFWPGSDTLYAFDLATLGTVDLTTGAWSIVGSTPVWDDGGGNFDGLDDKRKSEKGVSANVLSDIDSMTFDPHSGLAYAVARVPGADMLFVFNRTTGLIVRQALVAKGNKTYDFIRIPAVEAGNDDIDDIAIDPTDGQMYGIANGGGLNDRLVRIERDGISSDVGPLGVNDMEGLAYFGDGTLWGTTGDASNTAADGSDNSDAVFSIRSTTAQAFDRRPLTAGGTDFESAAFLTADLNHLCGRVWNDDDGNGTQGVLEAGLPNVTVLLWRDHDGSGVSNMRTGPPLATTTTDALGDYCFDVAATGDFVVTVDLTTLPADSTLELGNEVAASLTGFGSTLSDLDFITRVIDDAFAGTVWQDLDGDKALDPGEYGLSGVTVDLWAFGPDGKCGTADDVLAATTVTDSGGYYIFRSVAAGKYCIDALDTDLPPGFTRTTDDDPIEAEMKDNKTLLELDFGYTFPALTRGRVWLDFDGDGVMDPLEPGLPAIDVTLTSPGADGYHGTADDVTVALGITDSTGAYTFTGLTPGAYAVLADAADVPAGSTLTTWANPRHIALRDGQLLADVDFGFAGSGSIGDRVWHDDDNDGAQDAGELGFGGVTVRLSEAGPDGTPGTADDVTLPPQVTAADGSYLFPGLPAGQYVVDVDDATLPPATSTSTTANDPLTVGLGVGVAFMTADFGYKADDASIGDRVWNDVDGDGAVDAGEPGLDGVTVTLLTAGPDATFGTADDVTVATASTDSSGAYDFTALPAGDYRVDVDEAGLPAGVVLTTGSEPLDVTLASFQDQDDADFGYWVPAEIGDLVFEDSDGNGLRVAGEPGIDGVSVALSEAGPDGVHGTADDVSYGSQVTAGGGAYVFDGLPPGDFRVDVAAGGVLAGLAHTTANDPLDITLASGELYGDADFGYWAPASIGDRVWDDRNGDGVEDAGEPGLLGVTVRLTEAGPDAVFGTADDVGFAPAVTDVSGAYGFADLAPGTYRLDVDDASLPAGFALTTGNDPLTLGLARGASYTAGDFGYWRAASVGDRVWNDLDGDGLQDGGEPGLAGVSVALLEAGPDGLFGTADDVTFTAQISDVTGAYGFSALAPGTYRVDPDGASVPAGMALTTGNDPQVLVLAPGDAVTTVDFGYRHTGRIGDRVWDDLDGDGVQDAGEPGMSGIVVQLSDDGPDGLCGTADDIGLATAVTDGAGAYAFEALPGDSYCVLVDGASLPAGYVPTTGAGSRTVVLAPGQDVTDTDFGFQEIGAIGDRVWNDRDGDGVQDLGEPGLDGVELDLVEAGADGLFGTADDIAHGRQTTVGGGYLFPLLPRGLYRVSVVAASVPAGMGLTGGSDPLDVTLVAGQGFAAADFGFFDPTDLGGRVFDDLDGDGTRDAGEPGLVGVTVDLIEAGADGLFGTADDAAAGSLASGAGGLYAFTLPPGLYRLDVDETTGGGRLQTTADILQVTVGSGDPDVDTLDFGFVDGGSIGDRVWDDQDGDGIQDAGEPGLDGVQLDLVEAGLDGVLGTADDTAHPRQTSVAGAYAFPDLPRGLYRVSVVAATIPAGTNLTGGSDPLDVLLVASQDFTTADVGYFDATSLGGRVFDDLDGNGVRDAGEPGLSGVTVDLTEAGPDALLGTADDVAVGSAASDALGDYGFSLPPGLYRLDVDATTAGGRLQTTPDALQVTVAAHDADVGTLGFGFVTAASIGGRVFDDQDGNGLEGAGEPGLDGVQLDLVEAGPDGVLGTGDDVAFPRQTSVGGDFLFGALQRGLYRVTVVSATVPAGASLSGGSDPLDVSLAAAEALGTADFGYFDPTVLAGGIFDDQDNDGVRDAGEPGLAGVTVDLIEAGPDGVFGTADDVAAASATSDALGTYDLSVAPGLYRLDLDDASAPGRVTTTTDPLQVSVTAHDPDTGTLDFGLFDATWLRGRVFDDVDSDGVRDVGEAGLSGVTVDLVEAGPDGLLGTADDVATAAAISDALGDYGFALPPGLYRLDVDAATAGGRLQTTPDLLQVAVGSGDPDVGALDFGFVTAASIGDRVWDDQDGDGVQDVGEPGLDGVELDLVEAGPDGVLGTGDDVSFPRQTSAGGAYSFGALLRGLYRLAVVPASVPVGASLSGGSDPLDVALAPAEAFVTADLGYFDPTVLAGGIFDDQDNDGVRDAGEPGLAGVTVDLIEAGPDGVFGTADDVAAGSATSDALGTYDLSVAPGLYRLDLDDASAPGRVTTTTDPLQVTVAAHDPDTGTLDFGLFDATWLRGRVFDDVDSDGVRDVGEAGLTGVTVDLVEAGLDGLFDTADDVAAGSTISAASGDYAFALAPGVYRVDVDETTAGGRLQTTPDTRQVTVVSGDPDVGALDFGFVIAASIGDRVWDDRDGDGVQDVAEPGLDGVQLDLVEAGLDGVLGTGDDVSFARQTTVGGAYSFGALLRGLYRLSVVPASVPAGASLSGGSDPLDVTLAPAQTVATADLGFFDPTSLGGRVFDDQDGDGVRDAGEPGLGGVTVDFLLTGPDGVFGTADDVTAGSTVSNASGDYALSLPPALYRIRVDLSTAPGRVVTTTDPLQVTVAAHDLDVGTLDFGLFDATSVGGGIFDDLDGDGVRDVGEPGLTGVRVDLVEAGPDSLFGTGDDVAGASATSDASGNYAFALPPGLYRVDVDATTAGGRAQTTADTLQVSVVSGDPDVGTLGFGFVTAASIGDRVWDDRDGDGVQDPSEPGYGGVQLDLVEAGPDGLLGTADDVSFPRQTTAGGTFLFGGLLPGLYRVSIVPATIPPGTSLSGGSDPLDVTLSGGQDFADADFGFFDPTVRFEVGDVIWLDSDKDGVYDADVGELPLANVAVTLLDEHGTVLDTTVTDANGEYRMRLRAGPHSVRVEATNFLPGGPLEGMSATTTGVTVTSMGVTASTTIVGDNYDLDFGFVGAAPGTTQICAWWQANPAQWPVAQLTIGGQVWSTSEILAVLNHGNLLLAAMYGRSAGRAAAQPDMSVTVAWALIGAKFNVGAANNQGAVEDAIRAADAWLASVGYDSDIGTRHPAYRTGWDHYQALNAWNRSGP